MDRLISSRQLVLEEDIIEVRAFIDLFMIAPQTVVDEAKFCCMQLGAGCAISLPAAPAIGLNRILGLATLDDVEKAYDFFRKNNFFDRTGKISRKKLNALLDALVGLGDLQAAGNLAGCQGRHFHGRYARDN